MFKINNIIWDLEFVDPNDKKLMRSDGTYSVGCTDANDYTIYISNNVSGKFLQKIITHELCHAYMISYDVYMPIYVEEQLCSIMTTYGKQIVNSSECIYRNLCEFYNKCGE